MEIEISASIVTYENKKIILCEAINSFLNTTMNIKLYIIDNSPTDQIKTWLHDDPRIEYIFNNKNIGFGAAHNLIMKDNSKLGKYHLVLNPDIKFSQGTLEELYQFMEQNPDVGNVMPKILYPNGELQYLCKLLPTPKDWFIRMFVPIKSIKEWNNYRFEMRFTNYDKIMNVPYLSGCFMFLRKTVIETIGLFDEGIFMYGEDTDLNRRIHQKYKTIYFPQINIIHNFEKGSHRNLRLFWIHIKAALYYLNKWGWFFDKERKQINKSILQQYNIH